MAEILRAWDPDLSVLIGCAALLVAYCSVHRHDLSRVGWFVGGVTVMLFALISPIDTLGDEYLFSAHMLQHLLLELAVPPLLLLGITPRFARAVIDCWRVVSYLEGVDGVRYVRLGFGPEAERAMQPPEFGSTRHEDANPKD